MLATLLRMLLVLAGCWLTPVMAQTVTAEHLATAVRGHLQEALDRMKQGYQVMEVLPPSGLQVANGSLTMEIALNPDELAPGARLLVPVTLLVDGRQETTTQVTIRFKQRVAALHLRQALRRGEPLAAKQVEVRDMELTSKTDILTEANLHQVVGKTANRPLREGQTLQASWFDEPMVVNRGEQIRVSVVERGLSIETTAVAESHGKVGEIIQVRNTKSNRRFPVRLIGPGEGRVEIL